MSSTELKQVLEHHIIPVLKKAAGNEKKPGSARNQVVRHQLGQLFIIEQKVLFDGLDKISDYVGVPRLNKAAKTRIYVKYLKDISLNEKNSAKKINVDKLKILKTHRAEIRKTNRLGIQGVYAIFIVAKYETMKSKKRESVRTSLLEEYANLPEKQGALTKAFSERGSEEKGIPALGWDLGHGDYGDPSSAVGVTRTQQAAAKSGIKLPVEDRPKFQKLYSDYEQALSITIDHEHMFDDQGNFNKEYLTIISLQHVELNKAEAKDLESDALIAFKAEAQRLLESESSFKMAEALERVLMSALTRFSVKEKNVRYTGVRPRRKIKEKAKAKTAYNKGKYKLRDELRIMRDTAVSVNIAKSIKAERKTKNKAQKVTTSNVPSLLNKNLGQTIRDNMGSPGLVNQTGNFASSVRVLKEIVGKGRTLSTIQYTYDADPYSVFEMSERGDKRWATKARDPRLLIEKSVREVAAQHAMGKFKLQRL
jgi:hypothetical protein